MLRWGTPPQRWKWRGGGFTKGMWLSRFILYKDGKSPSSRVSMFIEPQLRPGWTPCRPGAKNEVSLGPSVHGERLLQGGLKHTQVARLVHRGFYKEPDRGLIVSRTHEECRSGALACGLGRDSPSQLSRAWELSCPGGRSSVKGPVGFPCSTILNNPRVKMT